MKKHWGFITNRENSWKKGGDEPEETNYEDLKTMNEDETEKIRNFETLRNLANGLPPDYKMDDIYKARNACLIEGHPNKETKRKTK